MSLEEKRGGAAEPRQPDEASGAKPDTESDAATETRNLIERANASVVGLSVLISVLGTAQLIERTGPPQFGDSASIVSSQPGPVDGGLSLEEFTAGCFALLDEKRALLLDLQVRAFADEESVQPTASGCYRGVVGVEVMRGEGRIILPTIEFAAGEPEITARLNLAALVPAGAELDPTARGVAGESWSPTWSGQRPPVLDFAIEAQRASAQRLDLFLTLVVGLALNFVAGGLSTLIEHRKTQRGDWIVEVGWAPVTLFAAASLVFDFVLRYASDSFGRWGSGGWNVVQLTGPAVLGLSIWQHRRRCGLGLVDPWSLPPLNPRLMTGMALASGSAAGLAIRLWGDDVDAIPTATEVFAETAWLLGLLLILNWLSRYFPLPFAVAIAMVFWLALPLQDPSRPLTIRLLELAVQAIVVTLYVARRRTPLPVCIGAPLIAAVAIYESPPNLR